MNDSAADNATAGGPRQVKFGAREVAYVAFLLVGLVTFRIHWHLLFDLDRGGFIQPYVEALVLVPPLALAGCVCALGSDDNMLRLVAIATVMVIAVQVLIWLAPASRLAIDVLRVLGQVYTALCLVAWPGGVVCRSWAARVGLLAVLAVLIVPLSLAWNPHSQALTGLRRSPGPLELQLFSAADAGDRARVQALLAAGARVGVKGSGGWDALMHAAARGDQVIVKALLAHGANPDTREDRAGWRLLPLPPKIEIGTPGGEQMTGRTALINAAVRGHADVVRELLAAGATPGLRDVSGRTARDWAEWAHRPDVVSLLQPIPVGR